MNLISYFKMGKKVSGMFVDIQIYYYNYYLQNMYLHIMCLSKNTLQVFCLSVKVITKSI